MSYSSNYQAYCSTNQWSVSASRFTSTFPCCFYHWHLSGLPTTNSTAQSFCSTRDSYPSAFLSRCSSPPAAVNTAVSWSRTRRSSGSIPVRSCSVYLTTTLLSFRGCLCLSIKPFWFTSNRRITCLGYLISLLHC